MNQSKKCNFLWALFLLCTCCWAQESEDVDLPAASRFDYGLWTDVLYTDGDWQAQDSFFDISSLYAFAKYDFKASSWSLFAEAAYERELNLQLQYTEELNLERAYIEYRWRPDLNFRFGKFNTQAGIIKPIHWALTLDSVSRPIMERNSYIPAKSTGLEIFGRRLLERRELNYSLALSYSESEITDAEPIDRATGAVLDVHLSSFHSYKAGTSIVFYRDPKDKDRSVFSVLPYAETYLTQQLLFRAELLHMHRDTGSDVLSYYVKGKWTFAPDWYLNLRYDVGDDEQSLAGLERRSWTATLAHKFTRQWRGRIEVERHRLEDANETTFTQWASWLSWNL